MSVPTIINIWNHEDARCPSHMTMTTGNGIAEWQCGLKPGHATEWHECHVKGIKGDYAISWREPKGE